MTDALRARAISKQAKIPSTKPVMRFFSGPTARRSAAHFVYWSNVEWASILSFDLCLWWVPKFPCISHRPKTWVAFKDWRISKETPIPRPASRALARPLPKNADQSATRAGSSIRSLDIPADCSIAPPHTAPRKSPVSTFSVRASSSRSNSKNSRCSNPSSSSESRITGKRTNSDPIPSQDRRRRSAKEKGDWLRNSLLQRGTSATAPHAKTPSILSINPTKPEVSRPARPSASR